MKVWAILVGILCVISGSASAQNSFWGVTTMGGENNTGVIFNASDDLSSYLVKKSAIPLIDAEFPGDYTRMTELSSTGELFGVTELGGAYNIGSLFKYIPEMKVFTKIIDFDGSNGQQPRGGLIVASNGKIYGTTSISDADEIYTTGTKGAIFEYDPMEETFEILYKFSNSNDGSTPYGTLCDGGNGVLYGTTLGGGDNSKGAVFQFEIASRTLEIIHSFSGSDGQNPYGGVVMLGDTLYGTTAYGGSGYGVVYQIDLSTSPKTFTNIYTFDGSTMGCAFGDLVNVDGTLYGVSTDYKNESGVDNEMSNGTIFSYTPGNASIETVYVFDDLSEGTRPLGALTVVSDNLIGVLSLGGKNNQGAIFKYNLTTSVDSIFSFETDGMRSPNGSLIYTQNGKLLGLCEAGGTANKGGLYAIAGGVIFQEQAFGVHPNGYVEEGANPLGTLTRGSDGLLYGNMSTGGANGGGTLFSYDPETDDFNVEYAFPAESRPNGKMILVDNRILVGMSAYGGDYNYGYVFTYNVYDDAFEIILHFNETNGKYPFGGLLNIGSGNLYGVTSKGGNLDYGRIFKLVLSNESVTYSSIHNFDLSYGAYPYADLQYYDGYIYGNTSYGTYGTMEYRGLIFRFNATLGYSANQFPFSYFQTVKGVPMSGYTEIDGLLYGTTFGYETSPGIIYSIDPTDGFGSFNSYNEEFTFVGYATTDQGGGKPYGGLTLNDDGKAFGMSSTGGENNLGVIYEFDPSTATYTSKINFDRTNGATPKDNTTLNQICNVVASVTYNKTQNKLTADYYTNTAEYQWYKQTSFDEIEMVPGEAGQEFMPAENGVYLVEITDKGCSNYSDYYLFYQDGIITELPDSEMDNIEVKVYPNPGSNEIFFSSNQKVKQIIVRNMSGQKVLHRNGTNIVQNYLDFKNMQQGVYFIKFLFENGNQKVVSFLKIDN